MAEMLVHEEADRIVRDQQCVMFFQGGMMMAGTEKVVPGEETMPPNNRRQILTGAALGVGGLLSGAPAFVSPAAAQQLAQPLPPGPVVTPHREAEIPNFKYSLDGGEAKVTSGGWAKEATIHQLPISTGIAGVHMFLNPGASRELHWHAIAAEWAYILEGRCQATILDPSGHNEVANFGPGDIWYFPRGHGHSIQTIGNEPCHFLLAFDNGAFSENGTFSITDWMNLTPPEVLGQNFGVPPATFASFPKGETYIMQGPVIPADSPQARENVTNAGPLTHKYSLLSHRATHDFPGGSLHLASQVEFPISTTMAGGLMRIKPGAIRELHWHPNANEWHYYIRGKARVGLFGSSGRNRVEEFGPGDVAYIPTGYGHYVHNASDEDTEMLVIFDNGSYQEIALTDWIATSPRHLLTNNFAQSEQTFAGFPSKSAFIRPKS
jgi:oxalate decarboxylase